MTPKNDDYTLLFVKKKQKKIIKKLAADADKTMIDYLNDLINIGENDSKKKKNQDNVFERINDSWKRIV